MGTPWTKVSKQPTVVATYGGQEIMMSAVSAGGQDFEVSLEPIDGGLTVYVRSLDALTTILCTVRKTIPDEVREAFNTLLALDDVSLRAYLAQLSPEELSRIDR